MHTFDDNDTGLAELQSAMKSLASTVPSQTDKSLQNQINFWKNGNQCFLELTNSGSQASTTYYTIYVLDDRGQWKVHTSGYATVQPNNQYTQGFHYWNAQDWTYQAANG